MERFTSPQFRSAVQELMSKFGYSHAKMANVLRERGVSFEDAHTAIFGRPPKTLSIDLDFTKFMDRIKVAS